MALILVAVLWFVFDKVEDLADLFSTKDKVPREDALAEPDTDNLTYPLIQYTLIANAVEVGLEPYSDDEEAVYSAFEKLKNNDDVLQLMIAFGSRKASPLGISYSYEGTLSEWLTYNLNQNEIDHVNGILEANGITIIF